MSRPGPVTSAAQLRERLNTALESLRRGDLNRADTALKDVLRVAPRQPNALHWSGTIALQRGKPDEAIRLMTAAVTADPGLVPALSDLGYALTEAGRLDEAARHLGRALQLKPDFPQAALNLGNVERARLDWVAAEALYRRAVDLAPGFVEAHASLAAALLALGRPREAEAAARQAIALRPQFAVAHQTLAMVLDALGQLEAALAAHREAVRLAPGSAQVHQDMGNTLMAFGKREEAVAAYRRALVIDPRRAELHRMLGKLDAEDRSIAETEAQYNRPGLPAEERMHLGFRLGKSWEEAGDFDRAFHYLGEANRLRRAGISYDRAETDRLFDDIEASFDAGLFAAHAGAGDPNPVPIFVLGMPRSGTTLVEQIIASHPEVFGAGELVLLREVVSGAGGGPQPFAQLLPRLADADFAALGRRYVEGLRGYSDARFVTDKMPGNFLLIGMIRLLLPTAKVIHCVRDAADTAISIYKNYFSTRLDYAYDLAEIGHYHRRYQRLMRHWHAVLPGFVHDVRYEDLIADQEGETRRLLAACGLDFRPECLEFFKTERPVHTASLTQVRSPIFAGSVGIARRYGAALDPLYEALEG